MKTKTWASIIAGIIIGMLCLGAVVLAVIFITPSNRQYSIITPQINVIQAPSLAPVVIPSATIPPEVMATLAQLPPDPGSAIQVGMTVHISGTGGDGLRIRKEPGVNATPLFMGADNEEFIVKDGPQTMDNLTWWYIVAPFDEKRQGWAAANYLAPNLNP
jgi:hypothetical protein